MLKRVLAGDRGRWAAWAAIVAGLAIAPVGLQQAAHAQQARAAAPAVHPGLTIYNERCGTCHDNAETYRAPTKATLSAMRFQALESSMTEGKMKAQAAGLSAEQRGQLINYLTGNTAPTSDNWTKDMMCPANRRALDLSGPVITGFGYDKSNTRSLTARQAGLTKEQLPELELAWAIAIPGATEMRAQPAIVGKTAFLPVSQAGALYAFDLSDPAKPCIKWLYQTEGGALLRTSASYGVLADGRPVIATAGMDTTVYLLDARTGRALWTKKVGTYSWSMNTGTPTVLKDRIIVPVSQNEISNAANNNVKCCDNHGYVVSLDPRDGSQQWRYDTMPDATAIRDRGDGKMLYGPSGAPIWNSPSIDEKRGLIYFGTGEANSPPAHINTDALIAIGLKDGKERWAMQATANDIYNIGCGPTPRPDQYNCVRQTVYRDVDFGASSVLARLNRGVEVVYNGQKSGTVWALQPDTGNVLWRRDIGTGGALGGVHWGIAFHNDTIYAPISSPGRNVPGELPVDPNAIKPGLYALDANTGAVKWNVVATPDCTGDRQQRFPTCQRHIGFSAAPTVIDGAVVVGVLDGYLRIYDDTGKEIWKYDTARAFQGINGVAGKGGSIDAASISAGNGLLIVNSGYGLFGQQPGNVILAFRPKKR